MNGVSLTRFEPPSSLASTLAKTVAAVPEKE